MHCELCWGLPTSKSTGETVPPLLSLEAATAMTGVGPQMLRTVGRRKRPKATTRKNTWRYGERET